MKLPSLLQAATLCAVAAPVFAQADWVLQLPDPGQTLRGLHVQSALVAWAAGGEGIVLRSPDGGLTWQEQQLTTDRLDAVRFQGSSNGLAAGNGMFRTTNAGTTWMQVDATSGLHDVVYASSTVAVACGDAGRLLRSTDGGATWNLQTLSAQPLLALAFANPSDGLVVGGGGEAFRTSDGGATWQALATGVPDSLTDVDLVSTSEAWGCAGDRLLHTTDFGQSWQQQPLPAGFTARGVDFVLPSHGWISGDGEWAAYTTDGGQTWTSGLSGAGGALLAVAFADLSNGLAVGENGTIYSSHDGGQSWALVAGGSADAPPFLEDFSAVDPLHAWAIGAFSEVFSTSDGGETWSEGVIDPQSVYLAIDFYDSQFGTVGGNRQGTFPAWGWTTDGGATWNSSYQLAQFNVYTAESFGPGKAIVAGSTWILRTTNTWQSFAMSSPQPFGTYYGSDSVGDSLWLVGTKFTRSVDGGASWQFLLDPGPTFRAVSFADAQNGWAVGDGGAILVTTDGGLSWQDVSLPAGSPDLGAVHAVDPSNVWIAGDGNYVAETVSGGTSWVQHILPTTTIDDYTGIFSPGGGGAWLAGGSYSTGGKVWSARANPPGCEVLSYCSAKPNSLGGTCTLASTGTPSVAANDFAVRAQGATPMQFGILFHSEAGATNIPFLGGFRCTAQPMVRLGVKQIDAGGMLSYPIGIAPAMSGTSRWYQLWYRDPLHPDGTGVGLSDGLRVTFCQ